MLTKGKYTPLHVDLEKSLYREVQVFVSDRGWTLAYFVRIAIRNAMRDVNTSERDIPLQSLNGGRR